MKYFSNRKTNKISIFLLLVSISMCVLTACTTNKLNQNSNYCSINKVDNLKYLNFFNKNLSLLKIPQNLNITFPNVNTDYYIPPIDLSRVLDYTNDTKISICPPMFFENIFDDSCLSDMH